MLVGKIVNGGIVFGEVLKICEIKYDELVSLDFKGKILVVKNLTPDIVLFIKEIKGVVAEIGGVTSHAAIIAMEFGVPCLVSVECCMQKLKNGDKIRLNGDEGYVEIIDEI